MNSLFVPFLPLPIKSEQKQNYQQQIYHLLNLFFIIIILGSKFPIHTSIY